MELILVLLIAIVGVVFLISIIHTIFVNNNDKTSLSLEEWKKLTYNRNSICTECRSSKWEIQTTSGWDSDTPEYLLAYCKCLDCDHTWDWQRFDMFFPS